MMLLIAERYRSSGQPKTERVNGWRASQRATQSHAIPGNRGDVNKRRRATSNSTLFFSALSASTELAWVERGRGRMGRLVGVLYLHEGGDGWRGGRRAGECQGTARTCGSAG